MSREEAIKFANCLKNNYTIDFNDMADFCNMAIEALQQQPSEDEKIIRIKKGVLKARTGRYVIYDVEWLKTHFNTTEAKIYGQPSEDYISRKAVLDALHSKFADGFDGDKWWNSTYVLDAINKVPSATPQPKIGQPKTGHWIYYKAVNTGEIICSKCSKCGNEERGCAQRMKYCPECGAKMQEVQ